MPSSKTKLVTKMVRRRCRSLAIGAVFLLAFIAIAAFNFRLLKMHNRWKDAKLQLYTSSAQDSLLKMQNILNDDKLQFYTASAQESLLEMHNRLEDAKLQLYTASAKLKVKAVIVFLAHTPRVAGLIDAIRSVHRNFNEKYRYPIVIFHEADFLNHTESVRHAAYIDGHGTRTSPIFFQQVDLSVPAWHIKKFGPPPKKSCWDRSIGYRSMCRFQAKLLYEQRIMRHFDYYWRLDDDSRIDAPVSLDLFDQFAKGGFSYGYVDIYIDGCASNIYSVAEQYMNSKGIKPTFFKTLKRDEIFYNNFEISSMKFWLSRQYRDFIEHMDSLGGIYKYRWGDAPIKTLALSMYVPLNELHKFTNSSIAYSHHPCHNC